MTTHNGQHTNWSETRFGKHFDVRSGFGFKFAEYTESGVPLVKIDNVSYGFIKWENRSYLPEHFLDEYADIALSTDDILVALNRPITNGQLKIARLTEKDVPSILYQRVGKILFKDNRFDHTFAFYLFQRAIYEFVLRNSVGSDQPFISIVALKKHPLSIPPLPEQQKIAAILSTWDRAIELTEKLIAAKQKRKQALMQQLLTGKVRLPEFQRNKRNRAAGIVRVPAAVRRGIYPPSVQAGIPKIIDRPDGWDETTMDNLLQIEKRPIELDDDEEYQLVVAKRNRGGIEPRERLRGHEVKTPTQFVIRAGDFVISKRQIIHGACGVVPPSLDGAVVSNEYSVCTVNGMLDIEFLKYLSHTLYFQQTCFHASVGVALEKMIFRLEQWLKFPFLIPPIDEQRAIASVLSAMDKEIDLQMKRVALLSREKKGLMQQLLTGKVRVKVDAERVKG